MAKRVENVLRRMRKHVERYRVVSGEGFRLADFDPGDAGGLDKVHTEAKQLLAHGIEFLAEQQDKLYAQERWAVLIVLQAMDAAGKDSTIKHVMSGVNPEGVQVVSFKPPSDEELGHDFLWRHAGALPRRGRIGIFNRSHYEEVLTVRVHPDLLDREKLPPSLVTKHVWKERLEDIRDWERYLARNGVLILKFFLHLSRHEQKKRFLERLDDPAKHWKFATSDVKDRDRWDDYAAAYEEAIRATAAPHAPWFVVPADHKWFTRLVVAGAISHALSELHLGYPTVSAEKEKDLDWARKKLHEG